MGLGPNAEKVGGGYWAVCFFDLMGYQRELLATDMWPTDETWPLPAPPVGEVAENSHRFGLIVRRRETLVGALDDYSNHMTEMMGQSQNPRSGLRQPPFDPLEAVTFRATGFSDSVFMEKRLNQDRTAQGIVELANMVACAGIVMVLTLTDHSPIRAGLDVGFGGSKAGMLYSAATVQAVRLEKAARYPRLLFGDHFLDCVKRARKSPNLEVRSWADRLDSLTFIDSNDKQVGLDFLGEAFKTEYLQGTDPTIVRQIGTFANASFERFKDATDEEGLKLRDYYQRFIDYVEPRIRLWGG